MNMTQTKSSNAELARDLSPIEQKLSELGGQLSVAYHSLDLLAERLVPVRAICPQPVGDGCERKSEPSQIEDVLAGFIGIAAALNARLGDLRGELRC